MTDTILTLKELKHQPVNVDSGKFSVKISDTLSSISLIGDYDENINNLQQYLTSVIDIGSNIKKLDDYCFYNCYNLRTLNIPETVKIFGDYCFYGDEKLLDNGIPTFTDKINPIYSIGKYAFYKSPIKDLYLNLVNSKYLKLSSKHFDTIGYLQGSYIFNIDNGIYIGDYAFADSTSLLSVTFLNSQELGNYMFSGCYNLNTVKFNNNVGSYVGEYCFKDCSSIISISIPNRFETLSKGMFQGCSSLSSIEFLQGPSIDSGYDLFGGGLQLIESSVFNNTEQLLSIEFPEELSNFDMVDSNAFFGSSLSSIRFKGITNEQLQNIINNEISSIEIVKDRSLAIKNSESNIFPDVNNITVGKIYSFDNKCDFKLFNKNKIQMDSIFYKAKNENVPLVIWQIKSHGCSTSNYIRKKIFNTIEFVDLLENSPYYFVEDENGFINDTINSIHTGNSNRYKSNTGTYYKYDFNFPELHYKSVVLSLLWFKSNGDYIAKQIQLDKNYSFEQLKDEIKEAFKGYHPLNNVNSSTKVEYNTIVNKFNGFGISHQCKFISNTGTEYLYSPTYGN